MLCYVMLCHDFLSFSFRDSIFCCIFAKGVCELVSLVMSLSMILGWRRRRWWWWWWRREDIGHISRFRHIPSLIVLPFPLSPSYQLPLMKFSLSLFLSLYSQLSFFLLTHNNFFFFLVWFAPYVSLPFPLYSYSFTL
jgi:hypothetical protein